MILRKYFHNSGELFSITLAGRRIYIVLSAADITSVLRNTKELTFHEAMQNLMFQFGATSSGVRAMWNLPSTHLGPSHDLQPSSRGKPLAHLAEDWLKIQLQSTSHLRVIQAVFLGFIHQNSTWRNLPGEAILSANLNPSQRKISLLKWIRQTIIEGATIAFFGPALLEIDATFVETFTKFDDTIWKLIYRIPKPWSNDTLAARRRLQQSMISYLRLPRQQRTGESWLVKTLETEMRARDIEVEDIATYLLMLNWV